MNITPEPVLPKPHYLRNSAHATSHFTRFFDPKSIKCCINPYFLCDNRIGILIANFMWALPLHESSWKPTHACRRMAEKTSYLLWTTFWWSWLWFFVHLPEVHLRWNARTISCSMARVRGRWFLTLRLIPQRVLPVLIVMKDAVFHLHSSKWKKVRILSPWGKCS